MKLANQPTTGRSWVRLDNSASIFLAARNEVDSKVFRLSADLDETIDPAVLQEALDRVYAQYPLFSAVLRRGVFWYYLQQSALHPSVTTDDAPSVTHLYRDDSRELLFRVLHRGRRISLEIFHALTDGTGALWFFQDLLTEYVGLRHPEDFTAPAPATGGVKQALDIDAFTHWFRAGTRRVPFEDEAASAVESTALPASVGSDDRPEIRPRRIAGRDVVQISGTPTPDLRTRVVELSMPVGPALALARAAGVSLTIFMTALFFQSVRTVRPTPHRARIMTVSVPVNLRQFFPTGSGRNFFATTRLAHRYGDNPEGDTLEAVCLDLAAQFGAQITRERLARKIHRLVRFERNPLLRVFPRPLKDRVLAVVNWVNNRGLTAAISNLGRVDLPGAVAAHVRELLFHVSAARPQFCMMSHDGVLTISFTSPFVETDYHAAFVRHLTERGVPVTLNVSRVTPEELA